MALLTWFCSTGTTKQVPLVQSQLAMYVVLFLEQETSYNFFSATHSQLSTRLPCPRPSFKMTYCLLLHRGFKWQKPTKNQNKIFVKLADKTYACNSLTNFEYGRACNDWKRKSCEFAANLIRKLEKLHQVNLFLAGFEPFPITVFCPLHQTILPCVPLHKAVQLRLAATLPFQAFLSAAVGRSYVAKAF